MHDLSITGLTAQPKQNLMQFKADPFKCIYFLKDCRTNSGVIGLEFLFVLWVGYQRTHLHLLTDSIAVCPLNVRCIQWVNGYTVMFKGVYVYNFDFSAHLNSFKTLKEAETQFYVLQDFTSVPHGRVS